ncbi:hypothetical protein IV38_GL001735 [Lactobacillus selangorensis]|uniref:DUF218 domain-containing protein n=1 Tax=Lactobacillus selangorensis TaxID=81857 RepID=A0A0R2FH34_9LACO|nr:YdcF family protein [Lactobacillus selangorensis]KRN27896.1 hypothetical protein IV38_GL001735 [Lactobacillus selangorensis]KRN30633.1 hypothetical protein IV40_GL001820 [Lactobacillus selangorensis]
MTNEIIHWLTLHWHLFYSAPVIFLAIFLFAYYRERRRLVDGVWFNLFFFSSLFFLAVAILNSHNEPLILVAGIGFILVFFVITFGYVFSFAFLLWNAFIVWRRESHTLGNMLTLLLGAGILALDAATIWLPRKLPTSVNVFFQIAVNGSILYLLLSLYNFLTVLVLYRLYFPWHNKNYIIVLGSGLINGDTVPPLLAARINRGIHFYKRQVKKGKPHPILLFSGGQGGDEKLPESHAMRDYALAEGIPKADTLVEDRSLNTLQNMAYSKAIIEQRSQGQATKQIFVTSDYHTFRASLFAREVGLKANGIGAKTSFYFLPNAIIREYIAIFMLHKKRHAVMIALIILFGLAMGLVDHFAVY